MCVGWEIKLGYELADTSWLRGHKVEKIKMIFHHFFGGGSSCAQLKTPLTCKPLYSISCTLFRTVEANIFLINRQNFFRG